MTKHNDGGAAFSGARYEHWHNGNEYVKETVYYEGMSLWDYFAAHALTMFSHWPQNKGYEDEISYFKKCSEIAEVAGDIAESMIAEREKRRKV